MTIDNKGEKIQKSSKQFGKVSIPKDVLASQTIHSPYFGKVKI
jgi:hypothetical protein